MQQTTINSLKHANATYLGLCVARTLPFLPEEKWPLAPYGAPRAASN
jgi:hypothetical protein